MCSPFGFDDGKDGVVQDPYIAHAVASDILLCVIGTFQ